MISDSGCAWAGDGNLSGRRKGPAGPEGSALLQAEDPVRVPDASPDQGQAHSNQPDCIRGSEAAADRYPSSEEATDQAQAFPAYVRTGAEPSASQTYRAGISIWDHSLPLPLSSSGPETSAVLFCSANVSGCRHRRDTHNAQKSPGAPVRQPGHGAKPQGLDPPRRYRPLNLHCPINPPLPALTLAPSPSPSGWYTIVSSRFPAALSLVCLGGSRPGTSHSRPGTSHSRPGTRDGRLGSPGPNMTRRIASKISQAGSTMGMTTGTGEQDQEMAEGSSYVG